jgi:hypothetical protein
MQEFYAFAAEHPILTFCLIYIAAQITHRILRTLLVIARGWPPPHLDADGDWKVGLPPKDDNKPQP